MRKRREDMEKDEAAEVLHQIDSEFDFEHQKLLEQRKHIADINRVSFTISFNELPLEHHCGPEKD